MKSLLVKTLQFICAGMLLLSPAPCGQLDHKFTMQVPFDFVAANNQFSAGDYTITSDTATGTVALRSGDTGPTVVVATYSAGDNKDYARARLIFNQYGNHFFLTQVPTKPIGRKQALA